MKIKETFLQKVEEEKEVLSRMNYLRGFFAILIVLGHCGRRFESEQLLLAIPHYGAYIWVCFFFTVSGWSLAYNFDYKEKYLEKFWIRKIMKLVLLAIETEIVAQFLMYIFLKKRFYINITILNDINWYIYEILVLYVLFWVSFRYFPKPLIREIFVWLISIFVAIGTWLLYRYGSWSGWSYAYYYSVLCFPLGISIHKLFGKIVEKKQIFLLVCSSLAIGSVPCIVMPRESFIGGVLLHNILGICAMIILIIVLCYLDVKKIRCLKLLTGIATYIYLYQFCVLKIIYELYKNANHGIDWKYVLLVLFFTVTLAAMVNYVNKLLKKDI